MKHFRHRLTALCCVALFLPFFGQAQIIWDNASASTDWYTATNWTPNTPQSGWTSTSEARFISPGIKTIGIDMSMGSLSVAKINATVGAGLSNKLTIGNASATPGILTLNGDASGNILYANFHTVEIENSVLGSGGTMELPLVNTNNNIQASFSSIKIGASITGAGKKLSLYAGTSGGGSIELAGANTYTGLTALNDGAISSVSLGVILSRPGGGTLPSSNSVTVGSKATLRIRTNQTLNSVSVFAGGFNGFLVVEDGVTLTITNKLTTGPGLVSTVGSGKIVYAPGATLEYSGVSGAGIFTTSAEFPLADGPTNIINNFSPFLHLHAPRTITGNFSGAGAFFLDDNNLTVGSVAISSTIITNGAGQLYVVTAGTAPVTFPVYAAMGVPNFVTISNGQNLAYGVRVEQDITPVLANSNNAVNRTWFIQPSATPAAPVTVQFNYSNTDGNPGFNYTDPVDLLQYTSGWNVVQATIAQTQPLTTTIASLGGGAESIFAIQNSAAALATAPIDITAVKQGGSGLINWKLNTATADVKQVILERSADGRNFTTLTTAALQQVMYTDNSLLAGKNYYRIKVTDVFGKTTYSAVVALLNGSSVFEIVSLLPNMVQTDMRMSVTSVKKTKLDVVITDALGRVVSKAGYSLAAGSNILNVPTAKLVAGLYYVTGITAQGDMQTKRFVKQ